MPRPRRLDPATLTLQLQAQGPCAAQALAGRAGVDRSRVSRALADLGESVVRLGSTRGARYALRRPIRGLGDTFPVRRLDMDGRAHDWAELTALHGGWRVAWAAPTRPPAWADYVLELGGYSEGFPFFLSDLRPQGYLGRNIGRGLPAALGLANDPREWNDDDTLLYLQAEGIDLPGNVVVGDVPLRQVQTRLVENSSEAIPEAERENRYPVLANRSMAPVVGGSSVEGEQPKFLTSVSDLAPASETPVMVKFTDALTTPTGRRWADLLVAEGHALGVLHGQGEAHATPRVLDAGGRRFLEIVRYDRAGHHERRGVVSLRALHDALPGADANNWTVRAADLADREFIAPDTLRSIRLRYTFGQLIGNTDMHFGNLAFWLNDELPFRLAPAYDMLPTLWAPVPGQATPAPEFMPSLPVPAERDIWHIAAGWAAEMWARVFDDPRVSPEFAAIARSAHATLARLGTVA